LRQAEVTTTQTSLQDADTATTCVHRQHRSLVHNECTNDKQYREKTLAKWLLFWNHRQELSGQTDWNDNNNNDKVHISFWWTSGGDKVLSEAKTQLHHCTVPQNYILVTCARL